METRDGKIAAAADAADNAIDFLFAAILSCFLASQTDRSFGAATHGLERCPTE